MARSWKLDVLALVAMTAPACLDSGSAAFDGSAQGIAGQVVGKGLVHAIAGAKPAAGTPPAQRQERRAGAPSRAPEGRPRRRRETGPARTHLPTFLASAMSRSGCNP
jgi:hypothetical protein